MTSSATSPQFAGSFTALITPFANGKVDEVAFSKLVEFQIESGTNGLVPVGTTGESPTLSHEERPLPDCPSQAGVRPLRPQGRALWARTKGSRNPNGGPKYISENGHFSPIILTIFHIETYP